MRRYRTIAAVALVAGLIATLALVRVIVANPGVNVRWSAAVDPSQRAALERQYDLRNGSPLQGTTTGWRYELGNRSGDKIRGLVENAAVEDTGNIDRDAMTAEAPRLHVSRRHIPHRWPAHRGLPD